MTKAIAEITTIALAILGVVLMGILMLWAARRSRRKSEYFKATDVAREYRNKLEGKPVLEQLKSKKTWTKVIDGLSFHDPRSDKAKEIKNDVIGTLGTVPFVIIILISAGLIALILLVFR